MSKFQSEFLSTTFLIWFFAGLIAIARHQPTPKKLTRKFGLDERLDQISLPSGKDLALRSLRTGQVFAVGGATTSSTPREAFRTDYPFNPEPIDCEVGMVDDLASRPTFNALPLFSKELESTRQAYLRVNFVPLVVDLPTHRWKPLWVTLSTLLVAATIASFIITSIRFPSQNRSFHSGTSNSQSFDQQEMERAEDDARSSYRR